MLANKGQKVGRTYAQSFALWKLASSDRPSDVLATVLGLFGVRDQRISKDFSILHHPSIIPAYDGYKHKQMPPKNKAHTPALIRSPLHESTLLRHDTVPESFSPSPLPPPPYNTRLVS